MSVSPNIRSCPRFRELCDKAKVTGRRVELHTGPALTKGGGRDLDRLLVTDKENKIIIEVLIDANDVEPAADVILANWSRT